MRPLNYWAFEIGVIGATILFLVALFAWVLDYNSKYSAKVEQDKARCEAAGGVYLDRTYSYGKNNTGHLYTCVDKSIIIKEF